MGIGLRRGLDAIRIRREPPDDGDRLAKWPGLVVAVAWFLALAGGRAATLLDVAWFSLLVPVPALLLPLLVGPVLSVRWRQWVSAQLASSRQLLVGIAASVGGMVFVALAVLVGTIDASAWHHLAGADRIGPIVMNPSFTWLTTLVLVALVFLGCLVHRFTTWPAYQEAAATVALSATALLPVSMLTAAYQIWRLVDVNIARTASGG